MTIDIQALEESVKPLSSLAEYKPSTAIILGSGWSPVAESFETVETISYSDIPVLGSTSVVGHAGKLRVISVNGKHVLVFQGRRHFYEGVSWTAVALPIFLSKTLGAKNMLITNAAGGINADFSPGDLMVINDHINMIGGNPLEGDHLEFFGKRFPDMSWTYRPELRKLLHESATEAGESLKQGVYCAVRGPSYETPAEVQMLGRMGADAVGMSTVPEAILANAAGLKVAGVSCITNLAAGISEQALTHEEVTETTNNSMEKIQKVLSIFLGKIANS